MPIQTAQQSRNAQLALRKGRNVSTVHVNTQQTLRDNLINEYRYVDIGVYGVPKDSFESAETTRRIESFVQDKRGFQMLYADSYLTREEFEAMYDLTLYREMRARYACDGAFPEVYNKICKKARSSSS